MAWSEDENKKAGWLQKKLRLRVTDAMNLDAVSEALEVNQSEAVAELCRRFLARKNEAVRAKRSAEKGR